MAEIFLPALVWMIGSRGVDLPRMKAVALTIEALALLNNEERKKKCKMALWPISVYKLPYGSGLQKGTASHRNS